MPLCLEPFGIVETKRVPALHFLAGVVFLAIIFIIGTNRTIGRDFPFFIRLDAIFCAVGILYNQIDATLGQTKGGVLIRLILTHGKPSAIAQNDTDAIVLLKERGDIVGIVIDGLAVIGGHGRQHVFAHLLTIQTEFVQTKASGESRGPFYLFR